MLALIKHLKQELSAVRRQAAGSPPPYVDDHNVRASRCRRDLLDMADTRIARR